MTKHDVQEIDTWWQLEFGTQPPTTGSTIARVRNKFETHGTVMDVYKQRSGRIKNSTSNENVNVVLRTFTWCPRKSQRQCFRENAIEKYGIHRILKTYKCRPFIPFMHAVTEDDPDRIVEFCEWCYSVWSIMKGWVRAIFLWKSSYWWSLFTNVRTKDHPIFRENFLW